MRGDGRAPVPRLNSVVSSYLAVIFTVTKPLRVLGRPRHRVASTSVRPEVDMALAGRRVPSALPHI